MNQENQTSETITEPEVPITIVVAGPEHAEFAEDICLMIEDSAKARKTGIAKRSPEYIIKKLNNGDAVIALQGKKLAGFCYIETWSHGQYVANSGLIVNPDMRKGGLGREIKIKAFNLARDKYPYAKVFGITTSLAVMKINTELGYKPVTFSELTPDDAFWQGCSSCPNYDILQRNEHKMCLCTGMLAPSKMEEMPYDLSRMIINDLAQNNGSI
ncbi:MAG: GNAT family N-acetyltransferase [Saprospiraceae bacterium]|jgi:N-acetylglutamate synthase-like GNAT family acetyltransferase|nr:GNAT family N-acetyltransferase [Saprospiraceae bacterium]MBK6480013.1 GNAT family N-acetyltransferase [Saprospiraceae bacterium]MBK6815127.1 GNAT family N-acetyltransferase [Saprospiraceae bacterium]MBK7372171.1 GNAT family N-acetyltransferase [Saprospiraceae bacterium]MBK7435370.1 GNAT family N-acetyltransferase [Saprospiraceae bacterium]